MKTSQEYEIGDCLNLLPSIPDASVDLILTDLPYGQTACAWDSIIDLERLWAEYKRILTPNGAIVLTCTFKFGVTLVNSNPGMFRYDLVWEKTKATGFLNANKMPMRNHEMILVFYNKLPTFNPQYTKGEAYTRNCVHFSEVYTGKNNYVDDNVDRETRNPTSVIKSKVITDSVYSKFELATVIDKDVRNPVSVIKNENYESGDIDVNVYSPVEIRMRREEDGIRNPVSVIKSGKIIDKNVYGKHEMYHPEEDSIRNPVSIIKHQNGNNKTIHPTQKPLSLWEWIIKTYTNPGDMVHDSCLGAGTTLEACLNLNRNCTCFELSDEWEDNYKSILSAGKGMWKLSKIFGREL